MQICFLLTWKEWTVRYFSNKGVYSALAENCSLGVCSHGKPHVSSHVTGEGAYFSKEKEAGGVYSKWRIHGFSLAESLPGKSESLSSSSLALLWSQGMSALPSGPPALFNWGFCLMFHISLFWLRSFPSLVAQGESYESKSLLPGVSWHKGWLTVLDSGLSNGVEESLSGDVFSSRWNF